METTKNKKLSYLSVIGAFGISIMAYLTPKQYTQPIIENEFIKDLKSKLELYNKEFPEDRLYLHIDKPFYEPGDDIWFSAYIRNAENMKPSDKSDIIHVELINPKGNVEKKISLIAKNGKAQGDFNIDKDAVGGLYKIKAYTQWMKNEEEERSFTKEIQVQEVILPNLKMKLDFERKAFGRGDEVIAKIELNTNENKPLANHPIKCVANLGAEKLTELKLQTDEEGIQYIRFNLPKELKSTDGLLNVMIDYNGNTESISRSIPIILNNIQLSFFPEGGDLVNNIENTVAFKALNEFNKPADIEGILLDKKGNKITSFSSYHQGMGAFKFTPKSGEEYAVKITKPNNIQENYKLPEAYDNGFNLHIINTDKEQLNLEINCSDKEDISLIAQVRGKIFYSTALHTNPGCNYYSIPTNLFPQGVVQITLFDSRGIARCERLTFVNKDKKMNISIHTEKEKYLPRDKVKLTITVKDDKGLPMPANLSMAVVNDQLLSFADDKSGNILSELLLQQDLNEKIEDPSFYFNSKEAKADKALDYLLMTSGWRRFTWEKILEDDLPPIKFKGERAVISGSVLDAYEGKPISDAKIKVQGQEVSTDKNGNFFIKKVELYEQANISFSADGYYQQHRYVNSYQENLLVYLYKKDKTSQYYSKSKMFGSGQNVGIPKSEPSFAAMESEAAIQQKSMVRANIKSNKKDLKPADQIGHKQQFSNKKINAPVEEKVSSKKKESDALGMARNDKRGARALDMDDENNFLNGPIAVSNGIKYYRARQFYTPIYVKNDVVETRTDFRNTIYWNPNIEVGHNGKKTIEFYTSDDITSFRTIIEGISNTGYVGRSEFSIFTQLPFSMSTKIPAEVASEDIISIPLTLKNNTESPLGGEITITAPEALKEISTISPVQTIMPGKSKTLFLDYKVSNKIGYGEFTVHFKACGLGDGFSQTIRIAPKGFPVQYSFSGQEKENEYTFEINKLVNGSLKATFNAYPNVVSDLMKGIEGILQEPYGCFEQTSCTAYPNAMVLDYLKTTDNHDTKTLVRATELLEKGYKRLTTFEASQKGYEWFGANPAHEGLTAYGIMEFNDMKKAGQQIDDKMLDRTLSWLLSKKDGKGGFEREKHAYHDFGRISDDILNAYIVYALAEAGVTEIKKEFETSYKKAIEAKDPYMLGMMANAAYCLKEISKAEEAMKILINKQEMNGSFNGLTHSITYSQGNSLYIETTSLAALAMIKSGKYPTQLNNAVKFLVSSRNGSGAFSSTQGTILALKALTEYAKSSKKTNEDGTILIFVDNKKVAEKDYKAGDKGTIEISGLEQFIQGEGKHSIKVKYLKAKTPLPYSVSINYNTSLPISDKECSVDLKTTLTTSSAKVGETVRLTATISNKKTEEIPSTMAIIGIPAGFSAQPWQLKELQEKRVFDYYEIKGNNIAIYYRGMPAKAIKEINLDLKAEMPGQYEAPASSAYLYYTNEYKTWSSVQKVNILKNES